MCNSPKISIITPVYNTERYLSQCVESIISQTFKDWELLLINDGSTDSSGEICDDYSRKDARIRVIHKKNTGQADCRNIAIRMARGELIGFIDSDDWIEPDMYEQLYDAIIDNGADISICGYWKSYRNGERIGSPTNMATTVYSHYEAMNIILDDKVIKNFCCDKLFKRTMITVEMPCNRYYEDHSTVFKWFHNAQKVIFCPSPKYHYRQRRRSTVHNPDTKPHHDFTLAEKERYNFVLLNASRYYSPNKAKVKLLTALLNECKATARFGNIKHLPHQIKPISNEILMHLPIKRNEISTKKYIRLLLLLHSPLIYVATMRLGNLFVNNKKKKRKYYD